MKEEPSHVPTVAVLVGFGADVKRDPAVRLVESKNADILEVSQTGSCTNGDGCRCVRVIGWK